MHSGDAEGSHPAAALHDGPTEVDPRGSTPDLGTPAPIPEAPGLEVDRIGDTSGTTNWLSIQIRGTWEQYRGDGDISGPKALPTDPDDMGIWRQRIRLFLDGRVTSCLLPMIGWHFAETIA